MKPYNFKVNAAKKEKLVIVVGGIVVDIQGRPAEPLLLEDCNPGTVYQSFGGVGRNIAESIARLSASSFSQKFLEDSDSQPLPFSDWKDSVPVRVMLISAVGNDSLGKMAVDDCRAAGIDTEGIVAMDNYATPSYTAILDHKGNLHCSVVDCSAIEAMTPEMVGRFENCFREAAFVVLETNLSESVCIFAAELCAKYRVPLVADPVSSPKSLRLHGCLNQALTIITPNDHEIYSLCDEEHRKEIAKGPARGAESFVRYLLRTKGVPFVVLTEGIGGAGIFALGEEDSVVSTHYPALPMAALASATGAGDSLDAGLVFYLTKAGFSIREEEGVPGEMKVMRSALKFGMAVAKITLESTSAVSPHLSLDKVVEALHSSH